MKKFIIVLIIFSCILINNVVWAKEISGEIIAVNASQDTLLFKSDQGIEEYIIDIATKIYLNNQEVSLSALKPVTNNNFQYAKITLNEGGGIESINSFYKAINIKVKSIKGNKVRLEELNTGHEITYNIDRDVKLVRNNYSTGVSDVRVGDKGIAILGIGYKLNKLVLYHYDISGILVRVNSKENKIILNVGSRLNPDLKKYVLKAETPIFAYNKRINLKRLNCYNWIKLKVNKGVKEVIARKI
ncbi:hypothetical protein [Orenia marismortui]|uniref:hypothetical protein n=1 Tax=Orenia marismortui TaxID=46469 RepID=UPI00036C7D99|nr:hypothetical protein [Orenia marismortui]